MNSKCKHMAFAIVFLSITALAAFGNKPPGKVQVVQALANVIVDKDIGEYRFDRCKITVLPAYNRFGATIEHKDAKHNEINIGIQWFPNKTKLNEQLSTLLKHYKGIEKIAFENTTILRFMNDGDECYMWTDGEHIFIRMEAEGIPSVPPEIAKAYLAKIPSKVAEMKLDLKKKDSNK